MKLRNLLPVLVAAVVFVAAIVLVQPPPTLTVVVAASDLAAGRILEPQDVAVQEFPEELAPADAFGAPDGVIGQTLRVDRSAGDILRASNLGEPVTLAGNERAVAIHVRDSAGLAGLLNPGDVVGVVAVLEVQTPGAVPGTYSKATIEPLRVLYLSPEFQVRAQATPQVDPVTGLARTGDDRELEGTVVLAVPTSAQVVFYDFADRQAANELVPVNALELLAALDSSASATLSLYLVPSAAEGFASSGLFLPDLIRTPVPTPTPTATPEGFRPTPTAGG